MSLLSVFNRLPSKFFIGLSFILLNACGDDTTCQLHCSTTITSFFSSRSECVQQGIDHPYCSAYWEDERVWPVPVNTDPPPADTTPPSKPILAIEFTANNEISLIITRGDINETDRNNYEISRNNLILTDNYPSYYSQRLDSMLDQLTQYCYSVVAIDAAGNRSVRSDEHCLTTPSSPLNLSTDFLINQSSNNSVVASDGTIYGGINLNALNSDGTLKWTSSLPRAAKLPVISNNGIIYTNTTNSVHAFLADGSLSWSFPLVGGTNSNIKVSNDTIYISGYENVIINNETQTATNIIALDLTGTFKWKYVDASGRIVSLKELGSDGTPYLEVMNVIDNPSRYVYQIQVLNLNGTLKWEYADANNSKLKLITVNSNGQSYLEAQRPGMTPDEDIFKLQSIDVNGSLDWEHTILSPINDVEIATDNSVYIATNSPRYPSSTNQSVALLESLNSGGILQWSYTVDISNETYVGPYSYIIFDDILLANDGKIYLNDGHKIHSLNPNGTANWISDGTYRLSYQPHDLQLFDNSTLIYLDTRSNNVRVFSHGTDGVINWRYAIKDENINGPNNTFFQPLQGLNEALIFGGTKFLAFDTNLR